VAEADDVLLVAVQLSVLNDGEVMSSIAMQEYLRLYPHLAGVAATVATEAEERFEAMRRDVRERLVDHLLDLEMEHRNRETVRRGWYYTREVGFRTWPASGERRST
jgi:hypothetical protein